VTLQTPFHLQRSVLIDNRHLIHAPVTGRATDAFVHMYAVIEIDVVGQVVYARPLDGLISAPTRAHDLKVRTVVPDLRVTVHAGLGRRHAGPCRRFDRRVTVATVYAVVADVVLVRELDGLVAFDERARVPRRAIDLGQAPRGESEYEQPAEDAQFRQRVGTAVKDLRHGRTLSS